MIENFEEKWQKLMKPNRITKIVRVIEITAGALRLKWKWVPARKKTLCVYVNNCGYEKKKQIYKQHQSPLEKYSEKFEKKKHWSAQMKEAKAREREKTSC